MKLTSKIVINSRKDLDNVLGTQAHDDFMLLLKGTMIRKQDVAVRPEDYGQPEYLGEIIEPVWEDVEDLSTIERFGFVKGDFA